jgi:hypothetical protein
MQQQSEVGGGGAVFLKLYMVERFHGQEGFLAGYVQYTQVNFARPAQQRLEDACQELVVNCGAKQTDRKPGTYAGVYPTLEVHATIPPGWFSPEGGIAGKFIYVPDKNRNQAMDKVYQLVVMAPQAKPCQADIDKFFNSFELAGLVPGPADPKDKKDGKADPKGKKEGKADPKGKKEGKAPVKKAEAPGEKDRVAKNGATPVEEDFPFPPPDKKNGPATKARPPGKGTAGKGLAPVRGASQDRLRVVTKTDRFLAAVADPVRGGVLIAYPNKEIKHFSYGDFTPRKAYRTAGYPHRMALDPGKGLLYVAASKRPVAVTSLLPPVDSDLEVYDVRAILAGGATGETLTPARTLAAQVPKLADLALSPDGRWLYYLSGETLSASKLVRLDTANPSARESLSAPGRTPCLCLSGDGKRVYAGGFEAKPARPASKGGQVVAVDAAAWKVLKSVDLPGVPSAIAATNNGTLFATGLSGFSGLAVVDMNQGKQVATWQGPPGRAALALAPDQKRLFYSAYPSNPASVQGLLLPARIGPTTPPVEACSTALDASATPRGRLYPSPDGRFLFCESGAILELTAGG